jgi:prevent-host-death family protein
MRAAALESAFLHSLYPKRGLWCEVWMQESLVWCSTRLLYYNEYVNVTAAYAKANLPELLKAVENGEIVTISRYNKPIADLVPSKKAVPAAPRFGTGKGKVKILRPDWDKPIATKAELEAFLKGRA